MNTVEIILPWINVKKDLPKENKNVWACDNHCTYSALYHVAKKEFGKFDMKGNWVAIPSVTHWYPMVYPTPVSLIAE